jgi:predicted acylesterase/phospholipase RssA
MIGIKFFFLLQAVHYLGLRDSVDVVFGSSAGSLIGAYFVTGGLLNHLLRMKLIIINTASCSKNKANYLMWALKSTTTS